MRGRIAIIIESSSVNGQQDLPGARKDANNWTKFLKSGIGGLWSDNEIQVMSCPKKIDVTALLTMHSSEYVFLAFSGHGREVTYPGLRNRDIEICLNDKETAVPIRDFDIGNHEAMVIDCCRGIESFEPKVASSVEACDESICNSYFSFLRQNPFFGHEDVAFKKELETRWRNKSVTMCSCSSGESAEEDANAGGYYTSLLISEANYWANSRVHKSGQQYYTLTTKDAHDYVVNQIGKMTKQQHPEYRNRCVSYPFAIKTFKYI